MTNLLQEPVLILNKHRVPIDACTVRAAIGDVCANKANFVCPETYGLQDIDTWINRPVNEEDGFITTASSRIALPRVIVTTYDRIPKTKVKFSRRNLWKRDRHRCQYCGKRPRNDEITIDHVIPRSQGGKTCFNNCVLACIKCNKRKNNRTPEQAKMPLVRMVKKDGVLIKEVYDKPKTPIWSPFYAVPRSTGFPLAWKNHLDERTHELYWDTELEN